MNVTSKSNLNKKVIDNFSNVSYRYLIPPFLILVACSVFFLNVDGSFVNEYSNVQKDAFYYINSKLAMFPSLQFNLTQLGDVLILFPFVSIFVIYSSKLWEAILASSILSLIVSASLKKIFSVPRPAAIFDNDSFLIIGKTLTGSTSLPSGHSMSAFIVIALLLFAFMPKKNGLKVTWCFFMLILGFTITFSRVGVGAHYPLDVIIGSTIGYVLGVVGVKITTKLNWLSKFENKNHLIILMVVLLIWMALVIQKIVITNLLIAYLALLALTITFYIASKFYVQKKN